MTPPRVFGTRERREAERGAGIGERGAGGGGGGALSLFVCVGSFSLLLNNLDQY